MSANQIAADPMTRLATIFAKAAIAVARAEMEAQNSSDPGSDTTEAAVAPAEPPRRPGMAHVNSTRIVSSPNMLWAAVGLAERGFWVPHSAGPLGAIAAVPRTTGGNAVAKAPLTAHGVKDSSNLVAAIFNWWRKWPLANIAIDLQRSGLLVIAPDSPKWLAECTRRGLPETPLVAQSGGGEGHYHFYYRRPPDCPVIHRINSPNEVDIQTGGYMVAPPSLHQSGRRYQWVSYAEAVGGAR
jgi:hypothetical protein